MQRTGTSKIRAQKTLYDSHAKIAIIPVYDGKIVLVKKHRTHIKFVLPIDYVGKDEDLKKAAIRIATEVGLVGTLGEDWPFRSGVFYYIYYVESLKELSFEETGIERLCLTYNEFLNEDYNICTKVREYINLENSWGGGIFK